VREERRPSVFRIRVPRKILVYGLKRGEVTASGEDYITRTLIYRHS
jgi:hypothetical protein